MTSEAQRLIGISLTKIAQARIKTKNGVNLHKNLLVATVLQKARYIFMEEAIQLVQQPKKAPPSSEKLANSTKLSLRKCLMMDNNNNNNNNNDDDDDNNEANKKLLSSAKNNDNEEEVIYFDLDENRGMKLEKENKNNNNYNDEIINNNDDDHEERKKRINLKRRRRRSVTESETQEAVQSILPKKLRHCHGNDVNDDNDDDKNNNDNKHVIELIRPESNNMDIDRITSLVSIFSLDLCSAQAQTGSSSDNLPNTQYLAMTV